MKLSVVFCADIINFATDSIYLTRASLARNSFFNADLSGLLRNFLRGLSIIFSTKKTFFENFLACNGFVTQGMLQCDHKVEITLFWIPETE